MFRHKKLFNSSNTWCRLIETSYPIRMLNNNLPFWSQIKVSCRIISSHRLYRVNRVNSSNLHNSSHQCKEQFRILNHQSWVSISQIWPIPNLSPNRLHPSQMCNSLQFYLVFNLMSNPIIHRWCSIQISHSNHNHSIFSHSNRISLVSSLFWTSHNTFHSLRHTCIHKWMFKARFHLWIHSSSISHFSLHSNTNSSLFNHHNNQLSNNQLRILLWLSRYIRSCSSNNSLQSWIYNSSRRWWWTNSNSNKTWELLICLTS